MKDKEIEALISEEQKRQIEGIELIASENYVSQDVYEAMGSVLTNKYAEGYPGHRYYGGCEVVDKVEQLAIDRVCKLFDCKYANVQPHSGSQANRAVIEAVCRPGDVILSLGLNSGGHLTHGSPVSFSGKYYTIVNYELTSEGYVDYDDLIEKAREYKPRLIIAGASAYSREWEYKKLVQAQLASIEAQCQDGFLNHGCILMFDMAHTAGLIAAGLMLNPVKYCDIVTSTTHKTLRGPRGGIILMKEDFDWFGKSMSRLIDSSVFPGNQGGPLENIIAAKAVCFAEASTSRFVEYQIEVRRNASMLAECLIALGYDVVSGGTDNHEFLVDLRSKFPDMTGKQAEIILGEVGITVNKNMIPGDTRSPFQTSGLRLGTAAITSRGVNVYGMKKIADWIDRALSGADKVTIQREVKEYISQFPLR